MKNKTKRILLHILMVIMGLIIGWHIGDLIMEARVEDPNVITYKHTKDCWHGVSMDTTTVIRNIP